MGRTNAAGKPCKILVNWDNVSFIVETKNYFGEQYTEVHCGRQVIEVEETLRKIENAIK